MTAKKRWLKKIYQDSQELKSSQEKISWSSSESDEDVFNKYIHTKKKKKVKNNKQVAKTWIKSTSDNEKNEQDYLVNIKSETRSSLSDSPFPICSNDSRLREQVEEENTTEIGKSKEFKNVGYVDTEPNSTKCHNCDSPFMNSLKLDELSPVLIRNSGNIDVTNEDSPILGRRRAFKKIRSNYKRKHKVKQQVFQSSNTSPDLFTIQPTQVIDCDSPEFYTKDNLSSIKPLTAPLTECIVLFPSQCGSEIKISDTSSSCSSFTKTDSSSLYHQPARRKKKYKKGGLASLLQKSLHLQRSRISIWQHELYTKKAEVDLDRGEVIEFFIKKEWREYGNSLLECEFSDNNKCSNIVSSTNTKDQSFIFIVIIGYSTTLNIIYKPGCAYKLLPPYSTKNIIYKSREIPCYYNVTKLMLCKEKQSSEISVS